MAMIVDMTDKIMEYVNEYSVEVQKELEQKLDETAKKILEYIKENAPRSGNKKAMADDFIIKEVGSGVNKTLVIYGENKGGLVHLVEFGFIHRTGKYVNPRPFLRPAFDAFTPKMLEDIKGIISGK